MTYSLVDCVYLISGLTRTASAELSFLLLSAAVSAESAVLAAGRAEESAGEEMGIAVAAESPCWLLALSRSIRNESAGSAGVSAFSISGLIPPSGLTSARSANAPQASRLNNAPPISCFLYII